MTRARTSVNNFNRTLVKFFMAKMQLGEASRQTWRRESQMHILGSVKSLCILCRIVLPLLLSLLIDNLYLQYKHKMESSLTLESNVFPPTSTLVPASIYSQMSDALIPLSETKLESLSIQGWFKEKVLPVGYYCHEFSASPLHRRSPPKTSKLIRGELVFVTTREYTS